MELRFLGAATTVTGSQFLLVTKRAKVLVDCGMFQGNPHEIQHNRTPHRTTTRPRSMPSS